ncbi:translocation protein SEC62 isoform X1 [Schistocerca serialis cubense]|uniref:translocation protein SEC62 isoform X1 n=1 Tax=Schistocerca serialis cubense TaxID=2023355 RepID=UPI00214DFA64|nr:translocation protein SEC62 isoform X1 [Schistocerca serialis cubense]
MAEKRKGKKRKEELPEDEPEKPSKEEYALAKWLRKNVPTKKTKFLNHNVEYFTAVKAVDAVMASHWVLAKEGEEAFFSSRIDVVEFLDRMLRHKFFHRAKKIPVSEQELKAKLKKKDKDRKKDGDDKRKKDDEKCEDAESSHAEGEKKDEKSASQEDKEKKKRKIRLEMHLDQLFVDGLDAYVWIYDPIPVYYWFFGTLLVLGAIAICLFPLWPPSVRKGVYYLSVAAAGFLVFIIALAVLRLIVFCLLWALTLGKHHLWLLPNLTEDVGFLASFWPLYQYEYKGGESKGKKKSKKKKDKDSDNEDEKQDDDPESKEESTKADNEGRWHPAHCKCQGSTFTGSTIMGVIAFNHSGKPIQLTVCCKAFCYTILCVMKS